MQTGNKQWPIEYFYKVIKRFLMTKIAFRLTFNIIYAHLKDSVSTVAN